MGAKEFDKGYGGSTTIKFIEIQTDQVCVSPTHPQSGSLPDNRATKFLKKFPILDIIRIKGEIMSFVEKVMNRIGYIKDIKTDDGCCYGGDVVIQDGKLISGNPYQDMGKEKAALRPAELEAAYEKISCVGASIDIIANNLQMIEPVFWDNSKREAVKYGADDKLLKLRRIFERPNPTQNRKKFLEKCAKDYTLHGAIYFAIMFDKKEVLSIKILDNAVVTGMADVANSRIGSYIVNNTGIYTGTYEFNGAYYEHTEKKNIILAPYINASAEFSYLPASPLQGAGIETLMYWYGCFHNKSLLQNGARPSLIFLIKSLLNPKHREQLREEIRIKHSGAANAGNAIIIDGSADKDVKQFSQNNKDMEFSSVLQAAEDAIYKRLGTNWVLGKNVESKDFGKGMEMLYDLTVCPLFQGIFNHLFDVFKVYNTGYLDYIVFYLEQDIPALRQRFLEMMKNMPALGIFTVKERRKMYDYEPLGDERDDELSVQSVKVTQTGANGSTNTTGFTKNDQEPSS